MSTGKRKGLPHPAALESYSAETAVEAEALSGEQYACFRSGLGLALYMTMDRPDIQFAVKTLSSYMSKPTAKALAALKHLTCYLDGTPDHGARLQSTDESRVLFDVWRYNDFIVEEATIPDVNMRSQFNLEAFSDSFWATRKSTSSGCIFINGALVMSICRIQASIAPSRCEAELCAANGLMVESIYLFRLCKFLCGDNADVGSDMVQHWL